MIKDQLQENSDTAVLKSPDTNVILFRNRDHCAFFHLYHAISDTIFQMWVVNCLYANLSNHCLQEKGDQRGLA